MGVVFISHSSKDNAETRVVRDWLLSQGWSNSQLFLDLDNLYAGDRWRQQLNASGMSCEAVILCMSDNWIQSHECVREHTFAEASGKPIIPVVIREITLPIPNFVTDFQFASIADPARREEGFASLHAALRNARVGPTTFVWPPPDEPSRSPYPGLRSLAEADAAVFFGRDTQIGAGLEQLRRMRDGAEGRVLVIAADSGAGKSSFLEAGLIARLRRDIENFLVLPTVRPGNSAMSGVDGLLSSLGLTTALASDDDLTQHLSGLQVPTMSKLRAIAAGAGQNYSRKPPTIVLPVDQAEELFTVNNEEAAATIDLLSRCLEARSDIVVIATIRSDSLGSLQRDPSLGPLLNLFNLPAMSVASFKDAIAGPASASGTPTRISDGLIDRVMADLSTADALPLLAFFMERLWADRGANTLLTEEDYQLANGLHGLIEECAQRALCGEEPAASREGASRVASRRQLELGARTFVPALVEINEEGLPVRRVARWSEFDQDQQALLATFDRWRLVVRRGGDEGGTVEVAHEALFRVWPMFEEWFTPEKGRLEELRNLKGAARSWARSRKKRDYLVHQGARLLDCQRIVDQPRFKQRLDAEVEEYLAACHNKAEASRPPRSLASVRFLNLAAVSLLVFGLAASISGWFMWYKPASTAQWLELPPRVLSGILSFDTFANEIDRPAAYLLEWGRWLCWGAAAVAVLAIFWRILELPLLEMRLRLRTRHALVFGRDAWAEAFPKFVPMQTTRVDSSLTTRHGYHAHLQSKGSLLRQFVAGAGRTARLVFVSGDDDNMTWERAIQFARWAPRAKVIAHLNDYFTAEHPVGNGAHPPIFPFAYASGVARQIMLAHPPYLMARAMGAPAQHIVIVGFGDVGQCLLREFLATSVSFAPAVMKVTVIDPRIDRLKAEFLARHPGLALAAEVVFLDADVLSVPHLLKLRQREGEFCAIYVAVADQAQPVRLATAIREMALRDASLRAPIFVCTAVSAGRQKITQGTGLLTAARLHASERINLERQAAAEQQLCELAIVQFGRMEDVIDGSWLFERELDRTARDYHEAYGAVQRATPGAPATVPWARLPFDSRNANRRAVGHLRAKADAAGFDLDGWLRSLRPGPHSHAAPPAASCFRRDDPELVEKIERLEHQRWVADRVLAGWSLGEHDQARKTRPDLLPADQLDNPARFHAGPTLGVIAQVMERVGRKWL